MKYDMVFEGGGAKGMVFVGALETLEQQGHTPGRLMGASAGAIMATFLAAGYSAREMGAALNEQVDGKPAFLRFLQIPPAPTREEVQRSAIRKLLEDVDLRHVPDFIEKYLDDALAALFVQSSAVSCQAYSFIEKGGLYAAQNFLDWLRAKLNEGIYPLERGAFGQGRRRAFGEMTLKEFREASGVELSLISSDTSDARMLILNHRTSPDCPLAWAVRMSMSFPLIWQEVVWQPEWGTYRGRDMQGHTVVDGGMLSNFPIELFLSSDRFVTDIMGEKESGELNVLGFLIDESMEVPNAPALPKKDPMIDLGEVSPIQRIKKLIDTMTQAHDKIVIDAFEDFVVRLPAKGYGTIEFDMSEARREALVQAGRSYTAGYFQQAATRMGTLAAGEVGAPTLERESLGAGAAVSPADRIARKILREE